MKRPLFPLRHNRFTTLAFHCFFYFMYLPMPSCLKDYYRLICQVGHDALPAFDLSAPFAIQSRNLFSHPRFACFSWGKVFFATEIILWLLALFWFLFSGFNSSHPLFQKRSSCLISSIFIPFENQLFKAMPAALTLIFVNRHNLFLKFDIFLVTT